MKQKIIIMKSRQIGATSFMSEVLRKEMSRKEIIPYWTQLENNQSFIQQKMQGRRRVY